MTTPSNIHQNTKRDDGDFPYGKDNVLYLLDWINDQSAAKRFGVNWLYKNLQNTNNISRSNFYNVLENRNQKGEWKKIDESLFYEIVNFLKINQNFLAYQEKIKLNEVGEDHLYFSVSNKLGMWNTTVREMAHVLPGFYASYRPSLLFPGAVVRGLVKFEHDRERNTFRTWEMHAYRRGMQSSVRRQIFEGYVWRREFRYIWIDQDIGTGVFRNNLLHRYYAEGGRVIALHGLTSGTWAGKIYSSKTYLERLDDSFGSKHENSSERLARRYADIRSTDIIPPDQLDEKVPALALALINPRATENLITV